MYEELGILTRFFKVESWDRANFKCQNPVPIDGYECKLIEFVGYDNVYLINGFNNEIQICVFKGALFVSEGVEKAKLQELCNLIRANESRI